MLARNYSFNIVSFPPGWLVLSGGSEYFLQPFKKTVPGIPFVRPEEGWPLPALQPLLKHDEAYEVPFPYY